MKGETEIIEIKDMDNTYLVSDIPDELKTKLKEIGYLVNLFDKDCILYHLILNLDDNYNKEYYIVSFVKGLYNYGLEENLWEVALIKKEVGNFQIRNIKGYYSDQGVYDYALYAYEHLKDNPTWFESLPLESN